MACRAGPERFDKRGGARCPQFDSEYGEAPLHLNGKLEAAYYNRGNDELKHEKYREAIRDYTKALKLYPTDAWALKNRGLAWKERGEMGKTKENWNRAKETEPGVTGADWLRGAESP